MTEAPAGLTPIRMPKWGLSMQEGAIVGWLKSPGEAVSEGEELVEVETSKITNVYESPGGGILRRILAEPGETVAVGTLIAVLAEPSVDDAQVEAFVAQAQAEPPPSEDEASAGLALDTIEVGGRTLRYGRAGPAAGVPTVLIHGYGGDLESWMFNIGDLAEVGPVIALDLPGHGGSSKDVGGGSLAELAGAVRAALAGLGVSEAHLVGHSLGGAVAARLAADEPGLARSLTLIAPAYLPGGEVSRDFVDGLAEAERAREVRPLMEMLLADPAGVTSDMVEAMLRFKRTDGVPEALAAIRDRLTDGRDGAELREALGRLGPTLVIASRGDRIVGAPDEAALPANLRVVWIEGTGHMPHMEQAAKVNALLLEARR